MKNNVAISVMQGSLTIIHYGYTWWGEGDGVLELFPSFLKFIPIKIRFDVTVRHNALMGKNL